MWSKALYLCSGGAGRGMLSQQNESKYDQRR